MKWLGIFFLGLVSLVGAEMKSVRVFIALCDNESQGIVPVGEKIGDGDVPDANLYWGCSDGLNMYFRKSGKWKVEKQERKVSAEILRRLTLEHTTGEVRLVAEAYKGSEMVACLKAFEETLGSGEHDLVAFIGHNGLMDYRFPEVTEKEKHQTGAVVLACKSESYFQDRIEKLGAEPLLLTQQFMYPGSFILHDVIEEWRKGKSKKELRAAAGKAYAKNQKISVKAATGVFSE